MNKIWTIFFQGEGAIGLVRELGEFWRDALSRFWRSSGAANPQRSMVAVLVCGHSSEAPDEGNNELNVERDDMARGGGRVWGDASQGLSQSRQSRSNRT